MFKNTQKQEVEQQINKIMKADILLKSDDEQELIKNIPLKMFGCEQIQASLLIRKLESRGYDFTNNLISYFSEKEQLFVFLGKTPLKQDSTIQMSELEREGASIKIMLKAKKPLKDLSEGPMAGLSAQPTTAPNSTSFATPEIRCKMMMPQSQHQNLSKSLLSEINLSNSEKFICSQQINSSQPSLLNSDGQINLSVYSNSDLSAQPTFVDLDVLRANQCKKPKTKERATERRISDIVEAVTLWRKLYNGIPDTKGNLLRYSLDDAAKKVGVSKKSLDDYFLQLKFGKRLGFDFEKYKNEKVGVLRKYVKRNKSSLK